MKKEKHELANKISHKIYTTEQDIKAVDMILENHENYRVSLNFESNKTNLIGRSFGAKKFDIKDDICSILITMKNNLLEELAKLQEEYEQI